MSTGEPDAMEIRHVRFGGGPTEKALLLAGTSLAAYPTSRTELWEPAGETPAGYPAWIRITLRVAAGHGSVNSCIALATRSLLGGGG
jgi:hypothetical protein